jgi:hypothetical protein
MNTTNTPNRGKGRPPGQPNHFPHTAGRKERRAAHYTEGDRISWQIFRSRCDRWLRTRNLDPSEA